MGLGFRVRVKGRITTTTRGRATLMVLFSNLFGKCVVRMRVRVNVRVRVMVRVWGFKPIGQLDG